MSLHKSLSPQKEKSCVAIKAAVLLSPINFTPHTCALAVEGLLKNEKLGIYKSSCIANFSEKESSPLWLSWYACEKIHGPTVATQRSSIWFHPKLIGPFKPSKALKTGQGRAINLHTCDLTIDVSASKLLISFAQLKQKLYQHVD